MRGKAQREARAVKTHLQNSGVTGPNLSNAVRSSEAKIGYHSNVF